MNSRSFNEQQTSMHQSGFIPQYIPMRTSNIGRELSNDQKIRRVSPLPQERFSNLSNHYFTPLPTFQPNQYQLPIRNQQPQDYKKMIQELTLRIQKLEMRSEKSQKLVQKLDSSYNKFSVKVGSLQDTFQGNQNRMNIQNCINKSEDQFKQKMKNLITREQLQRQLIGLDSAFKTLIKEMKTNTNLQMRDIHTKEKKAMIQVVASQITDKLEAFKQNFITELSHKIESAISENLSRQLVGKNVIGLSKQKFLGTTVQLKLCQELYYSTGVSQRQLTRVQAIYYVDTQGYLLDSSCLYLVDKNNSKIKLSTKHLEILKKEGLLNKQGTKALRDGSFSYFNEK